MTARAAPRILAVDPGTTASGYVLYDPLCEEPIVAAGVLTNDALLSHVRNGALDPLGIDDDRIELSGPHVLAVEMIASYGMPVGREVFDTCVYIGRLLEAWHRTKDRMSALIYRREVKSALCGSMKAKDANVWQAILDRFGGKVAAVGKKASPGPLYGVHSHARAALAVALTYLSQQEAPRV